MTAFTRLKGTRRFSRPERKPKWVAVAASISPRSTSPFGPRSACRGGSSRRKRGTVRVCFRVSAETSGSQARPGPKTAEIPLSETGRHIVAPHPGGFDDEPRARALRGIDRELLAQDAIDMEIHELVCNDQADRNRLAGSDRRLDLIQELAFRRIPSRSKTRCPCFPAADSWPCSIRIRRRTSSAECMKNWWTSPRI